MKKVIRNNSIFLIKLIFFILSSFNYAFSEIKDIIDGKCLCMSDWQNHNEYVLCVTTILNDLKNQEEITQSQMKQYVRTASQSDCGKPGPNDPDEDEISVFSGKLIFTGIEQNRFDSNVFNLNFTIEGGNFSNKLEDFIIELNGSDVTSNIIFLNQDAISVNLNLVKEQNNNLSFYGLDSKGYLLIGDYKF